MAQQDLYSRIPIGGMVNSNIENAFLRPPQADVPPGWHPPQALSPPPGQGPTYGDERKRLAEESMKVDRAPAKIRETQETKSDGQKIKTLSNDEAKVVKKIGPDGKVSSLKITTNDTVNDPIDGSPLVSVAEAEQGAQQEPFVGPQLGGPLVGPRQEDGGPMALGGQPSGQAAPQQAQSLRARLNNAPQGAAQFQAPPRTWANMDWTPLRKLTDDIYGTNIAEGSVDPYIAEYKRAFEEFKLNNPAAGKGGKDSTLAWAKFQYTKKTDRDKLQYNKDRKIEKDLAEEKSLKENLRRWEIHNERQEKRLKKYGTGKGGYKGYAPAGTPEGDKQAIVKKRLANMDKPTTAQAKAEAVAATAQQAEHSFQDAVRSGKASGDFNPIASNEMIDTYANMPEMLRWTQNKDARAAHSASNRWLNTLLRQETGAAMPVHEIPAFRRMYFPGPGDTPKIVESKREARRIKVNSAKVMQGMTEAERLAYWKEQSALEKKKLAQWEADNPVGAMTIELDSVKSEEAAVDAELKKLRAEEEAGK